ncbi:hypothetical protein EC957_012175 [Mortierella hygrophila]|uniref:Uncharacterized protein n=1 Tax=Mortierella hygrophila TaxID=979708 RepID=A0A9P6K2X3_9FUNG|nr:hypothetical protein EC957_012175 [Mortierella hygrophila]
MFAAASTTFTADITNATAMSGTSPATITSAQKPSLPRPTRRTISKQSLFLSAVIFTTALLSVFAPATITADAAPTIGRSDDDNNSASIYGCPSPEACQAHCKTMMNSEGYCGEYPRRSCFCTLSSQ